jgi:hypothetical protein
LQYYAEFLYESLQENHQQSHLNHEKYEQYGIIGNEERNWHKAAAKWSKCTGAESEENRASEHKLT